MNNSRRGLQSSAGAGAKTSKAVCLTASKLESWTTLEEDYIAFLLPAPNCTNCTNCIKQVLMLELSKTDS
jgi:hypothetical protein